jgi:hypothetical protein
VPLRDAVQVQAAVPFGAGNEAAAGLCRMICWQYCCGILQALHIRHHVDIDQLVIV